ncbi:MAG: DUF4968 domain-containing protein, partial [Bacteroidales bacterium]|nr:DUF4968 domain-containing protein [Bacteroidales bacterium]
MKKILTLVVMFLAVVSAGAETKNGVELKAGGNQLQVTFYSPQIVRVQKCPESKPMPAIQSEVVTMTPLSDFDVKIQEGSSAIKMSSSALTVTIDKRSGLVQFAAPGKNLLKEKNIGFEERTEGSDKGRYIVTHTYQLDKDEAIYG